MSVLSNRLAVISFIISIFNCCHSGECILSSLFCDDELGESEIENVITSIPDFKDVISSILPSPLCDNNELGQTIKNVLTSLPDFKNVISKFDKPDFLNRYKLGKRNEDKHLNISTLVAKYGFKLEKYPVQTEDGYKITVNRIPSNGDTVLLVHGVLSSAIDWFTIGRDDALPYLLANLGYDVWLFNARGTSEDCKGHVSLSPEKNPAKYWDFSWDEIGRYDLPATIDVVLMTTGKIDLKIVAHSQGSTAFFVMGSVLPDYNQKVSLMVALSPIAYMKHTFHPLLRILAVLADLFAGIIRHAIGFYEFDTKNPIVQLLRKVICGTSAGASIVCGNIMFSLSGFNYEQVNATQMPVIFGHTPSTIATKQLIHYAQSIVSGKFRCYDYGLMKNLKKYGTAEPPAYPIEQITSPVALFYRTKNSDWLSSGEDVMTLKRKLPNVVDFYEVPDEKWCHTDYLWAKDVKHFVYDKVIELLENPE